LVAKNQLDWPVAKKKLAIRDSPKFKILGNYRLFIPLANLFRFGGLWAKHMGLKRVAIGNTLQEHIENLIGTHWELDGNILRTGENEKKILPPTPAPPKT
jgi:hypothetical protein